MLKRPFVSLLHSLKSNQKKYYWVPPNSNKLEPPSLNHPKYDVTKNDITKYDVTKYDVTKYDVTKYDVTKNAFELIKKQDQDLKVLNEQLTRQKQVLEELIEYSATTRLIQMLSLYSMFIVWING
jgi:hypothetical protein